MLLRLLLVVVLAVAVARPAMMMLMQQVRQNKAQMCRKTGSTIAATL